MNNQKNAFIIKRVNDELSELRADFWSSNANDHLGQLEILLKMINILTDALTRIHRKNN